MSGNIHAKAALNDGNLLHEQQIEAILSLTHELRTRNLIALLQPIQCGDGKLLQANVEFALKVSMEIHERLGLPKVGVPE